ncbi:MAG: heterodisulfide reductase [Candidatus Fischerbacteria bacterium RBG_13_37_8]|uniref:Heterodisulfide reductase n=1 Tax=Candidatus Fischerbacteria bacterium RBG_13_37_8 TaxID=1817863 RepID=A0A1F5VP86_9BACT|nr:MAG: heterodisulfide reductase [Candidatus Fischerbacteria bacterium RBG_13_37_8]
MKVQRTIKYEEELNRNFPHEVADYPGGENLWDCIQCGTCSGTCPVSLYMDHTPRKIIAMIRGGFKDDVLKSFTIWICSSCYACTVQCPMTIKITEIMYSLKRMAIDSGYFPKKFAIPVLAREFVEMVKKNGRVNEGLLTTKLMLKTEPFKMLKSASLGIKLMRAGRMNMFASEKIRKPEEITKLLDKLEEK